MHIDQGPLLVQQKEKRNLSLLLLRERKSNNFCYHNSSKCNNYKKRNKGKQQRNYSKNETKKIKSDNFRKSNGEIANIVIALLFCILGSPILFSLGV